MNKIITAIKNWWRRPLVKTAENPPIRVEVSIKDFVEELNKKNEEKEGVIEQNIILGQYIKQLEKKVEEKEEVILAAKYEKKDKERDIVREHKRTVAQEAEEREREEQRKKKYDPKTVKKKRKEKTVRNHQFDTVKIESDEKHGIYQYNCIHCGKQFVMDLNTGESLSGFLEKTRKEPCKKN